MGATPLLRAARAGDAPFVQLLLEHGALVDLPSNQGVTPLMAAAGVEYGLRVTRGRNRTDEGVLATMKLLVDAGADIDARMFTEPKGDAAAHLLVIEQRLSDFSYDYRGRQVPSPRAIPHRTALHGAAMKGFNPFVEFLVAHGADMRAKDANGLTPLDLAMGRYEEAFLRQAAEPHPETVELLQKLMAEQAAETAGSQVAAP
jgi:ankyrin repeat protein